MSGQTSLKAQNAWLIRAVLAIHAVIFACVAFEPVALTQLAGPNALEKVKAALAPGSLSLAIIVLAKLILLGLVPAQLRDRLIHWRWRHPLPGSRAFSRFGPSDPRADMARLETAYGPLPTDPGEQSRLFYKIYSAYSDRVGVLDAHGSYLAARDIGIINLILFILLPGFAWWATADVYRAAMYACALFSAYVLTAAAAQVYGVRLVENVLAAASADHD
ncbi:hypothetical protein [Rhodovibrio sodomensis]|nr:hypothetical protein [Rhodovibrio sodomensis]